GGQVVRNSPLVTLGVDNGEISLVTEGGLISVSGLNQAGDAASAELGAVELLGTVNMDTTNEAQALGAAIDIVSDDLGAGIIDAAAGATGDVVLALTAGTGDVRLGDIGLNSPITTLTITSAANVNLNNLFVASNTIDIAATGDVVALGQILDSQGDITIVTEGGIELHDTIEATQGTVTLISNAGTISVQGTSAGGSVELQSSGDLLLNADVSAQSGELSLTSDTGNLTAQGQLDSGSNMSISANQDLNLVGDVSAGGTATFESTAGTIETVGTVQSADSLTMSSTGSITLGSNITSSNGSIRLTSSESTIDSNGTISAGADADIIAQGTITLNGSETTGIGLEAGLGETNVVSSGGDLIFNSDIDVDGTFKGFSISGAIDQQADTNIAVGESATLSADTGIRIAQINAVEDVTLVITAENEIDGETPLFQRVNEVPENSDLNPDVRSQQGSIIYLAPIADVGTADNPLIQRTDSPQGGIFYGLEQGQVFSVDIGLSRLLATIPNSFNLNQVVSSDLTQLGASIQFDFAAFIAGFESSLIGSTRATGRVGQTAAAASSRSTAAAQREEDEEVAEVDEAAFQNLKNYDENPQGIKLPPDQQFAYDDEGNIYYIVTLPTYRETGPAYETFTLYRVDLDLKYKPDMIAEKEPNGNGFENGYRQSRFRLSWVSGAPAGGD
ncbi:MAG: hypothetical protein HUJ31_11140, partial [Pseudomonadales bacterium]|nr:hypothetical protein [Pseudomonadales bacterium]